MAKDMKQRYVGSTSSVSAVLSHFYFVMSNFKHVNTSCLSRAFDKEVREKRKKECSPSLNIYFLHSQQNLPAGHVQQPLFTLDGRMVSMQSMLTSHMM
jgi:hypothetical protein